MTVPEFVPADLRTHRADLLALNVLYMEWVFPEIDQCFGVRSVDAVGMDAAAYAAVAIDKLCDASPPEGIFYLVRHEGRFVAMGGLRAVAPGTAEIKRIYVHPDARGLRLGQRIVDRLLDDARAFGYRHAVLDTAPFMTTAHRIYEAAGFVDRGPYPNVEVPELFHPKWRFMERGLGVGGAA